MFPTQQFGFAPGSTMGMPVNRAPVFPTASPQMGGFQMPPMPPMAQPQQPGGLSSLLSSPQGLMQAASLLKGFGGQGGNQPPAPKPGSQLATLPPSSMSPGLLSQLWQSLQSAF